MNTVLILTAIILGLVILIAINFKRQYQFILTITDGQVQRTHGQVDEAFVNDVQRICELFNVKQGTVKGVAGIKGVNIVCAGPVKAQQRAIQNAMNHPI
ncbi:MAG: DUF3634 family protein [Phycisphaeraceae bacterium JB051]